MSKKPCCPMLPMVLDRARPADRAGLERGWLFNTRASRFAEAVVVRARKGLDRKAEQAEHWESTLFEVNFCPFCGAKLAGRTKRKPATPAPKRARGGR
jgi:hypothetical protein